MQLTFGSSLHDVERYSSQPFSEVNEVRSV
jgi:hypothetical protein